MGLDITAYSELHEMYEDDEELANLLVNPDFPDQADDLSDGFYSFRDSYGFRAGSYGGYNAWREELAKLAGYPELPDTKEKPHSHYVWTQVEKGPFYELINFADNEGVIGPKTAYKLLADFTEFEDEAQHKEQWFYDIYLDFMRALHLASNNGAVDFH